MFMVMGWFLSFAPCGAVSAMLYTGSTKIIVSRLCGCCGGAVHPIISISTDLHRLGFNLEFETLFESI